MRNLKRALSLTLASVMLLGMMVLGSSAASFNDADDIENVTAATILQELGIMQGASGNFAPKETVTRGQMAIIICKMLYGERLSVSQFAGTQQFDDVPANQYYTGYVNLAANLGIISGYGNGNFGPGDPITTAQAALMLTRALGYYQNNELTGQGWAANALTAMTLATRLDIFNGLNLKIDDPLSRDNVSAMTFNTMTRATPVKFNNILKEYYTDGGGVTDGVAYIDAYEFGRNTGEYRYTLAYTIYGLYISERNDRDDMKRPADEWSYENGGVIGSFNDEPIKVFTSKVTSKALYDAIGKNAVDGYKNNFNVSINGEYVDYTADQLNANKNDDNDDFNKKVGGAELTGNGVITEIYVDGADQRVNVVVYDTYAAEVYSVKDGKVTLADLFSGPAETDDEFEATGFSEDEVVVYTYANNKIQSVYSAEKLEGKVTRVRANTTDSEGDNFNVDSTTYNYNRNLPGAERLTTENVDNQVVAYLDANGYAIYIDESAVTYDYAYVLTTHSNPDPHGGSNVINARLVLTDGTILKVETDDDTADESLKKLVSYSANKNNVYALAQKDNATASTSGTDGTKTYETANTEIFKNGRATFILPSGGTFTANANTTVIVADSDDNPDEYSFTVFTGVKNIPDITSKTGSQTKIDIAADEKGVAKVVYIEDADVSGVGNVIYLRADTKAKLVQASGDNKYYEISAVVDGKLETLMVKESSEAAKILRTNAPSIATQKVEVKSGEQYILAAKSLTYDGNGLVTNVKFFDDFATGDGTNKGEGTTATKSQVAFLLNPTVGTTTSYPYGDDVTVVRYNVASGKFSVSSITSIKDDTNDKWVSVADDYSLTGVCIIEIKGGEGSGTTTPKPSEVPGLNVDSSNWNASALNETNAIDIDIVEVATGTTVDFDDIEAAILAKVKEKKPTWIFVEGAVKSNDYVWTFKVGENGSPRYVKVALSDTENPTKVTSVTDSTGLNSALQNSDKVILDGDASISGLGTGKEVVVSEGKELTVSGTVSGTVTGAGNVKINSSVTGGENIRVDGVITLGSSASVGQLGVYSEDPDEEYVADVVLDGTSISENTNIYGNATITDKVTVGSGKKLTAVEVVIGADGTLDQVGDIVALVMRFEKGGKWKLGDNTFEATNSIYIDFDNNKINGVDVSLTGGLSAALTHCWLTAGLLKPVDGPIATPAPDTKNLDTTNSSATASQVKIVGKENWAAGTYKLYAAAGQRDGEAAAKATCELDAAGKTLTFNLPEEVQGQASEETVKYEVSFTPKGGQYESAARMSVTLTVTSAEEG